MSLRTSPAALPSCRRQLLPCAQQNGGLPEFNGFTISPEGRCNKIKLSPRQSANSTRRVSKYVAKARIWDSNELRLLFQYFDMEEGDEESVYELRLQPVTIQSRNLSLVNSCFTSGAIEGSSEKGPKEENSSTTKMKTHSYRMQLLLSILWLTTSNTSWILNCFSAMFVNRSATALPTNEAFCVIYLSCLLVHTLTMFAATYIGFSISPQVLFGHPNWRQMLYFDNCLSLGIFLYLQMPMCVWV